MAIVTKTLGAAVEPEGTATLSVDYDNVQLRLTLARIVNTHPTLTARVTATATANPTRSYSMDGPPPVSPATTRTTTQNIPTGQTQRLDITIDARGRLDGVSYTFGWLAP